VAVKSTTLSFGLVTTPVALQKAKEVKERSLPRCSAEGKPVKQMYVVEETGELVGTLKDTYSGVPTDDGTLAIVPKEALDAITGEGKIESLVVDGFIPAGEVPTERVEGCYFIAPGKDSGTNGTKTLALLRDGLKDTGMAGIGKMTLRTKQRPFVVFERDGALILNTLGFADAYGNLVVAREKLAAVTTEAKTLGLFKTLVEAQKVPTARLDEYVDEVAPKREKLIEAVLAGEKVEAPKVDAEVAATVDLEAALIASIAA
jgi:DNA end-binding protein Ku